MKLTEITSIDRETVKNILSEKSAENISKNIVETDEKFSSFFDVIVYNQWYRKIEVDNNVVGLIFLNPRGETEELASTKEMGYVVASEFQGRGYATEAVALAVNYGMEQQLTEIWASVEQDNEASKKVLLKNDFKFMYTADYDLLISDMKKQDYYRITLY